MRPKEKKNNNLKYRHRLKDRCKKRIENSTRPTCYILRAMEALKFTRRCWKMKKE
jgi:hypothetical protein